MSKIGKDEVLHIAKLSKLELTEKEEALYSGQLSSVLEYVGELSKLDVSNLEETSNVTGLKNRYREDKVKESGLSYDDITLNAPQFEYGFFVVPQIFE